MKLKEAQTASPIGVAVLGNAVMRDVIWSQDEKYPMWWVKDGYHSVHHYPIWWLDTYRWNPLVLRPNEEWIIKKSTWTPEQHHPKSPCVYCGEHLRQSKPKKKPSKRIKKGNDIQELIMDFLDMFK